VPHGHPESRVIRPLRAGDIVAFPYFDAVGRYTGEDTDARIETDNEGRATSG
jgi:hypothetical protein